MIYRGPGFLAVIYDLAPPPPPLPFSMLDRRHTGRLKKESQLADVRGGKEEPYHTKVWSSINHSILSGLQYLRIRQKVVSFPQLKLLNLPLYNCRPGEKICANAAEISVI